MTSPTKQPGRWRLSRGFRVLAVIVAVMSCLMVLVDIVPPHKITVTYGLKVYRRIFEYSVTHKAAPATLAAVQAEEVEPRNFYKDGWGRAFQYTLEPDGTVTLASLGKDGVSGAANGNGGFTWRLLLKNQDGSWIRPDEALSAWDITNGQNLAPGTRR